MGCLQRFIVLVVFFFSLAIALVYLLIRYYQVELTELLVDVLEKRYSVQLSSKKIKVSLFTNWPNSSIQFKNVELTRDGFNGNEPILKAGSVSLSFNLKKLLYREFIVRSLVLSDAYVTIIKGSDNANDLAFESPFRAPKTSADDPLRFDLKKISFRNTRVAYINRKRPQKIELTLVDCVLKTRNFSDGISALFKGRVYVNGLLLNEKKGPLLAAKEAFADLEFDFFKEQRLFCLHAPSVVEVDKQIYNLSALLELKEEKKLSLIIEGNGLNFSKAGELLSPKVQKVLASFKVSAPVNVKTYIVSRIGKGEEPLLITDFSCSNCDIRVGAHEIPYNGMDVSARLISMDSSKTKGDLTSAKMLFTQVKGKMYDVPFTAKVMVSNLRDPFINVKALVKSDVKQILFSLKKDIDLTGSLRADIEYSGPAKQLSKNNFTPGGSKITAYIHLYSIGYYDKKHALKFILDGTAKADNKTLRFKQMRLLTNAGTFSLTGVAGNFIDYLTGDVKILKIKTSAFTKLLNLNRLLLNDSMPQSATAVSRKFTEEPKANEKNNFELDLSLFATQVNKNAFIATDMALKAFVKREHVDITQLSMYACAGIVKGKLQIENLKKVRAELSAKNLDVKQLFIQFQNFNQQAILEKHLEGKISVDTKIVADLSESFQIKGESIEAEGKLKVENGRLMDYDPVKRLSNFLFRNRNFNDIVFSELNQSFSLNGYEMKIHELEIASTLLNLYIVDGTYNFKGYSNINILIPWANLKKRERNAIPVTSGQNAAGTKGVKINYSGTAPKMKFSFGHKAVSEIH
jgi:hypothetical protein